MNILTGTTIPALLLLFVSAAQADDWTKQWSVSDKPELYVRTGDVSITIEGGAGHEISATLKTRGMSIGSGGLKVIEHQDGNRVELEIRDHESHFSFGEHSADLHIRVPREITADVQTGDGSIRLDSLSGNLRINTGDGSIQGSDLRGGLNATSGDGSMHLAGRFSGLRLKTQDGSVDVRAEDGSSVSDDWRVETGDGSVHVSIPSKLAANLRIHTGDGGIHCDLPVTLDHEKGEHDLAGKLNGGGSYLDIHTGDGSVSIGSN